jgi:aldose 1-epimerase
METSRSVDVLDLAIESSAAEPRFTHVSVLPGRGMATWRLGARVHGRDVDVLHGPPPESLDAFLANERFPGNATFGMGGAILLPFANRVRGRLLPGGREIETEIDGRTVRLPANWSGIREGAERFAMHGLVLDSSFEIVERTRSRGSDCVVARRDAGNFGGRWPSHAEVTVTYELSAAALSLRVVARNAGPEPLPVGIGWHPYFNLPSLRRERASLRVPARRRAWVNDYDEVLPTGELVEVAGSERDFTAPEGRALGELHLDDCYTDLVRDDASGEPAVEVRDAAAGYGVRVVAASPAVRAFQVYAPRVHPYVVVEPQTNLANPFGAEWPADVDTGMARLAPSESLTYAARVELLGLPRPD